MSVQLAPSPVFQGITATGAPLVGGQLFTYAAGTTTPQATYIDSTQTTQNTNPVILNAMGQAFVWTDSTLSYKFVLQDAANNTLYTVDHIAGVNSAILFPPSQAEINAGVTLNTNYPWGDVRRYGAVLDGATDCTAAMVNACKVGGNLTVPGNMALASAALAALANQGIALNPNTTIQGYAAYTCTITGTAACNVFWSINPLNIWFYDFWVTGNGPNSATTNTGYFWYQQCTAAATAQTGNCGFIRGALTNFAGLYWIYVDNTAAVTFPYVGWHCDATIFTSMVGNNQGPTLITVTAAVFGFSGSNTITAFYTLKDVMLSNCTAYGNFIKEFVFFWSGVLRGKAHGNTLVGFGTDASISNDTACYALCAYDFAHGAALQPNEIEFWDNTIDGVRDVGIYMANPLMCSVSNNRIQSATGTGGTIPKAAITGTAAGYLLISGNHINGSMTGISIAQPPFATARVDCFDNAIHNVLAGGAGINLSGTTLGNAQDINVDGLRVDTTQTAVTAISLNFGDGSATHAVGINNLNIENWDITGAANGIKLFDAGGSSVPAFGVVRIGRGRMTGITGNNIQWLNATNAAGRCTFESIDFMAMQPGAVGFFIQSAVNLTIRALTFYDMTSGATFCWYGGSATGRVEGVRFVNVAAGNRYSGVANELGVITPIFTGNDNDFVQDLNPNELIQVIAATNVKYTRQGWQWDRVTGPGWKEVRALTGN